MDWTKPPPANSAGGCHSLESGAVLAPQVPVGAARVVRFSHGQNKKPEPWSVFRRLSWAPALKALASVYVDQDLALALAAPGRQLHGLGGRRDLLQLAAAVGATREAAPLWDYSTTFWS